MIVYLNSKGWILTKHSSKSQDISIRRQQLSNMNCLNKDYRDTKTVHSYTYEWEKLQRAIWRNSPIFLMKEPIADW